MIRECSRHNMLMESLFVACALSSALIIMALALVLLGQEDMDVDGMASEPQHTGISLEKYLDMSPWGCSNFCCLIVCHKGDALRYSMSQLYHPGCMADVGSACEFKKEGEEYNVNEEPSSVPKNLRTCHRVDWGRTANSNHMT